MSGTDRFPRSLFMTKTLRRRLGVLLHYFMGQGLTQILGFSVGLLLLRWLSVDNYAQFSIAFGFQTTLSMLTDLGFSATIVALVGTRKDDPEVIGKYIRSGRHLRNYIMVIMTPLSAIIYIFIVRQHHWNLISSTLLFVSIVASIYFSGMVSYYSAPLLIKQKLSHYYGHQVAGVCVRLATTVILYISNTLTAWTTSWANALGFLVVGILNRKESRSFITLPDRPDPNITKQMIQYILPSLPSLIFFAMQGQISIFLISIFGQTRCIAEVGALGRLAQLFLFLSSFNVAVIEPYMARLSHERVARNYLMILFIAICICIGFCLIGFLAPGAFLMLLGPRYAGLRRETGWLIVGSSMSYLVGVTWYMATARRWIFWTTSWVTIGMILCVQIIFLFLIRVDSTMHVIWFGCVTSAAHFLSMLFNGAYGYMRGPKIQIPEPA